MEKSKNNIPRYIIIGALLIIFLIAFVSDMFHSFGITKMIIC